jgi:hypothetical protein
VPTGNDLFIALLTLAAVPAALLLVGMRVRRTRTKDVYRL